MNWPSSEQPPYSHRLWLLRLRRVDGFKLLLLVILAIGMMLRFVELDHKIYWGDETTTLMRLAGYTWKETDPLIYNQPEVRVSDLQNYQKLTSEKTTFDTIRGLAQEEPQHPPLYFALARWWTQQFGSSAAVVKGLSGLFSIAMVPCAVWLCYELTASWWVGWVAAAILAVSPFHLVYAIEARQYSLWTTLILLSSAVFLRAMRRQKQGSWVVYSLSVAASLYTFPLSALVVAAHGVYALGMERWRLSARFRAYLLAAGCGIVAFLPWVVATLVNAAQVSHTTAWGSEASSAGLGLGSQVALAAKWVRNCALLVVDFDRGAGVVQLGSGWLSVGMQGLVLVSITGFALWALVGVCRGYPKSAWLLVLVLVAVPGTALMLPDLLLGGVRSAVNRYMIPSYLGIQLAIAFYLAGQLRAAVPTNQRLPIKRRIWQMVLLGFLGTGLASSWGIAHSPSWWHQNGTTEDLESSAIVNQSELPFVILGGMEASTRAYALSYLLKPETKLQPLVEPKQPTLPSYPGDLFLFRPSPSILNWFQTQDIYQLKPRYTHTETLLGSQRDEVILWKLEK
jgi:uncharacterized membrane protein